MLGGDTNEFDIDRRNCNGDMYQSGEYFLVDDDYETPTPVKTPARYQFETIDDLLQCQEVQDLIARTLAHKELQIRDLENELFELSCQLGNELCRP